MANDVLNALESMATQLNDAQFLPVDDDDFVTSIELLKVEGLGRKLKSEIKEIKDPSRSEVKMLVNLYYQMQEMRKAIREQIRSIEGDESKKMNIVILDYFLKNFSIIEYNCKTVLQTICEQSEVGRWLLKITGIGPVLAAGCLAYFDINNRNYATQFISYAGLNDNNRPWIGRKGAESIMKEISSSTWLTNEQAELFAVKTKWSLDFLRKYAYHEGKGWRRTDLVSAAARIPYNKELKTLCWKIGRSFVYLINNDKSLYAKLYAQRKLIEIEKNENGEFADQAAAILHSKNFNESTEAYKAYSQGKLPNAHIVARAMRWTEKIFVSHLFECMYRVAHKNDPKGNEPPRYYALEHLEGHHDYITPEVEYPC